MSHVDCFIAKPIAIEDLVKRIGKIMTMDAGYQSMYESWNILVL
jgi:hypothetical protein